MANIKYFAEQNGQAVELTRIRHNGGAAFIASNFSGFAPDGSLLKATRMVEYKRFASKHVCDSRCYNATGKIMKCECSCGGKNHGRGSTHMTEVAA